MESLYFDTRKISDGKKGLFFAIRGEQSDGHQYLEEAFNKGVRDFVIDRKEIFRKLEPQFKKECNYLWVKNSVKALQTLARYHRSGFEIPVLGITGSNGKTIIKEWLHQLTGKDKTVLRSPKSYNSQLGVPLSVWELSREHDLAIFEAGISRTGEMENLEQVIKPSYGLFTNIGEAHQAGFSSMREKTGEKLKLFRHCEKLIYCKDHRELEERIKAKSWEKGFFTHPKFQLLTWSQYLDADLRITGIHKSNGQSRIKGKFHGNAGEIRIPFIDSASVENAIHCWLCLLQLGYGQKAIARNFGNLSPVEMRLEIKEGIGRCTLINDSYNSDPKSLDIALESLDQQKQHSRKTVILSDILQTGQEEKYLYRGIARILERHKVQRLIGIGPAISRQGKFFKGEKHFFRDTGLFLRDMHNLTFKDEGILLKGARSFRFEKISSRLQQKAHETVFEISLDALAHNLNVYRSYLETNTRLMVMVKAFSYGSGTSEIANLLQFHQVDYLGVAFSDEGVTLRKAGIHCPVMVMNPGESGFEDIILHGLEPEIYSLRHLKKFIKALEKFNKKHFPIHLKLETGMHRLGFEKRDLNELIRLIKDNHRLTVNSVFSHLSASDEPEHDTFTREQIKKFKTMSRQIKEALNYPVLSHILNTAGILRFPEARFNMVRLGLGLYGVDLTGTIQSRLKPVGTLKTTISQIKKVKKGTTVGYGRKGKATRNMTIAVTGIGYADGFDRWLGNGKGYVMIRGKKAPTVGNVCMDMTMVDITGIPAKEGDEVIVFGQKPAINELAKLLHTIPYEILTNISQRVKRVYLNE